MRITLQLIKAEDSSHLWSEVYERDIGDVFAVQDEIAVAVASVLKVRLAPGARGSQELTADTAAYQNYLRGKYLFQRREPGDVRESLRLFQTAVALDPNFAEAWVSLAGAYYVLQSRGYIDADATMPMRRDAIMKALELDPALPEAHVRAAQYYWDTDQAELRVKHDQRALMLDPNNPLVLGRQAGLTAWQGKFEEAAALERRALERDPLSMADVYNMAIYLLAAGKPVEAEAELRKVDGFVTDVSTSELSPLLDALILQARFDEALALSENMPEGRNRLQHRVIALFGLRRVDEASALLPRLDEAPQLERAVRRAEIHAFRGEADAALAALEALSDWLQSDAAMATGREWASRARMSAYLNRMDDPRWPAFWDAALAYPDE